jgi:LytS/YehU family sensor histidine kinase
MNNYQMAAIRAQMNPHFIFNCINSIQRYILTNDKTTAYNYLTKFSKLIRLVLNNSEEENITLTSELEMVGLYVELEQLRFEEAFIYDLIISEDIDSDDCFIPPMMLQPYIENSIWHGIMGLNGLRKGKISISISEENEMLRIDIKDNGIGRDEAMKHQTKNHKSKANKLNERRINIINNINHTINGSINIYDIHDDINQTIIGTQVTLIIPQNYE